MAESGLTGKQADFARAYATEAKGNGRRAAEIAGYGGDVHSLDVSAYRNLHNPRVTAFLQNLTADFVGSQLAILQETADVAFSEWREHIEIVMKDGVPIRLKMDLTNKVKALELLAKTQGMLTEKLRVEVVQKALVGINLEDV